MQDFRIDGVISRYKLIKVQNAKHGESVDNPMFGRMHHILI